jgi:hypothetical protein
VSTANNVPTAFLERSEYQLQYDIFSFGSNVATTTGSVIVTPYPNFSTSNYTITPTNASSNTLKIVLQANATSTRTNVYTPSLLYNIQLKL